jgi:hypothetical protein
MGPVGAQKPPKGYYAARWLHGSTANALRKQSRSKNVFEHSSSRQAQRWSGLMDPELTSMANTLEDVTEWALTADHISPEVRYNLLNRIRKYTSALAGNTCDLLELSMENYNTTEPEE